LKKGILFFVLLQAFSCAYAGKLQDFEQSATSAQSRDQSDDGSADEASTEKVGQGYNRFNQDSDDGNKSSDDSLIVRLVMATVGTGFGNSAELIASRYNPDGDYQVAQSDNDLLLPTVQMGVSAGTGDDLDWYGYGLEAGVGPLALNYRRALYSDDVDEMWLVRAC